jgi:hypothetical protein
MKFDGIDLHEGSIIKNLTVHSGVDFPLYPNIGEIYYKIPEGLYVYDDNSWIKIVIGNNFDLEWGNITGSLTSQTDLQSVLDSKLNASGGNLTDFLTLHSNPTNNLHATTKQYVDSIAEGLSIKPSAKVATTAPLSGVYNNGVDGVGSTLTLPPSLTLNIDGITSWVVYDGILVKDQLNPEQNGRYYISQIGNQTTDWILTRCLLCDEPSEIKSLYVFIQFGTSNSGSGWTIIGWDENIHTVGTSPQNFTLFTSGDSYISGTNIDIVGNVINAVDVVNKTGDSMTGTLDLTNNNIINLNLVNYSEQINNSYTINSGILTIDLSFGTTIVIPLSQNITEVNVTNTGGFSANKLFTFTLIIIQHIATPYTFTWPSTIKWDYGDVAEISPVLGSIGVYNFMSYDSGTSWLGFINSQEME